jgi:FKBP-type peptidyl-prolyl cis-trans isomerase FklB
MKKLLIAAFSFTLLMSCGGKDDKKTTEGANGGKVAMKSYSDSLSYAIGYGMTKNSSENPQFSSQYILEDMLAAFMDSYENGFTELSEEQLNELKGRFMSEMQAGGLSDELKSEISKYDGGSQATMYVELAESHPEAKLDMDLFKQGSDDYMNGKRQIDSLAMNDIFMDLNMKMQSYQAAKTEEEAKETIAAGEAFLAAKEQEEGVIKTASGLLYEVVKKGNGPKPTLDDKVEVHYHGTLIDGTVFDSSYDRGETTEFGITQVIRGWTEGLQLMNEGSTFMFYIPQELAYGMNPRPGGAIKPGAALVFKVELVDIK